VEAEDYPANLIEFGRRFQTDEDCRAYLESLRWPNGFRCPKCEMDRGWSTGREGLWECAACHRQTTVTAGTLFEGTRKPLQLWFLAMWLITSEKNGISALGLQRQLGFQRYETIWTWLHKLCRAMVRPGRDRLSGRIEVDETYVGGEGEGIRGRGAMKKYIVVIAAEEDGSGIGRIRLRRVGDVSHKSLLPVVQEVAEPGSLIHTDGWKAYNNLPKIGYQHEVTIISRSEELASELMPRVHRVASLLKRWFLGTHQGSVGGGHLDYYLDEFTFRFNRRKSRKRGKLFYRLVQQAVQIDPVTWKTVAAGTEQSD
jgi:transposase-like protein